MKGDRLSAQAQRDLSLIATAMASRVSAAAADDVVDRIRETCRLLGRHPLLGRSRADDLGAGIRSLPSSRFIVIYRVTPSGVLIQRIIDGRRDYPRIFRP